jgi:hypothetical protein
MAEHVVDGVRVTIKEGKTGLFFATSPDVKGLLVAEPTKEETLAAVPQALKELAAAKDFGDTEKGKFAKEIMERDDGVLEALS